MPSPEEPWAHAPSPLAVEPGLLRLGKQLAAARRRVLGSFWEKDGIHGANSWGQSELAPDSRTTPKYSKNTFAEENALSEDTQFPVQAKN